MKNITTFISVTLCFAVAIFATTSLNVIAFDGNSVGLNNVNAYIEKENYTENEESQIIREIDILNNVGVNAENLSKITKTGKGIVYTYYFEGITSEVVVMDCSSRRLDVMIREGELVNNVVISQGKIWLDGEEIVYSSDTTKELDLPSEMKGNWYWSTSNPSSNSNWGSENLGSSKKDIQLSKKLHNITSQALAIVLSVCVPAAGLALSFALLVKGALDPETTHLSSKTYYCWNSNYSVRRARVKGWGKKNYQGTSTTKMYYGQYY